MNRHILFHNKQVTMCNLVQFQQTDTETQPRGKLQETPFRAV